MVSCPKCERKLPEDQFGVCRRRPSGRNLYCKCCIREKVNAFRRALKGIKVARKPFEPAKPTDAERVRYAIKSGAKTRDEIGWTARLDEDRVADSLAELICEQGTVGYVRQEDEPYYFLKTA